MHNIITTTINTLEGWTIEEYHEPITAVVVGANVISDIAASWTNFSIADRAPMSRSYTEQASFYYLMN